ncbi:MAG: transcriptional repressor [Dehalococcoidales bacterium]|jgi:Fe2+ or Zn2+ uptake regulation protein
MEENSRKVLSAPKIKFTNQRALILEIIHHGEGHLDADEVYRRARDKQPRLSLSTVYRTLRRFKELGLIEEVHFDEAHHHYEVKPLAEHHHLLCLGCGRVIEFHYPLSRYVKRNVPEARGFRVVETEIRMTGYCPGCRQDKK